MARQVKARPILGKYPKPLIECTGRPETGKSQLAISFALWLKEATGLPMTYVWPTDGREHEYAEVLGDELTLAPEANPLDISAVHDEIEKDLKNGVFDKINFLSVDTVTHVYRGSTMSNQLKTMKGQGSSGHATKAVTMMTLVTIMMAINTPLIAITHRYAASKKGDLRQEKERDSISEKEEMRWKLAFNIKLETFLDKDGYGVIVRECRERPGMEPFILRDEPDGMFRTMPERIMNVLYVEQPPSDEPQTWDEFDEQHPFPDKGPAFKKNAIREMVNYFMVVDGQRFYAFGDPTAKPTKKNGDPGINGAWDNGENTYKQVAKEYKANNGTSLGELTVLLKEAVEERIQKQIDEYLASQSDDEESAEETSQPDLGLDAYAEETKAGGAGGAAYADAIPD